MKTRKNIIIVEIPKKGKRKVLDKSYNFVLFSNVITILTFKTDKEAYCFLKETDSITEEGSKIIFKEVVY